MSRHILLSIGSFMKRLEQLFFTHCTPPPQALALTALPSTNWTNDRQFDLKQIIGDGILWAVPKHRRSIEKRLKRKFGHPDYCWKLLKVKTNLRNCQQCGHYHEIGILCPHCYDRVRTETQQMQEKIQEKLGLDPVDKEVIVLYEGERNKQPVEVLSGKRIVEMPKSRPMWFTRNLLQKSTQEQADPKEVKPTNLG